MRKTAAVAAGAALFFSAGTAAPAIAVPSGSPVEIVAHTDFTSDVSEFDASLASAAMIPNAAQTAQR